MVGGRRLDREHIEAGASQVTRAEGVEQCFFVDKRASGGIDEACPLFHSREASGIHHRASLVGHRRMQADDVACFEKLLDRDRFRSFGIDLLRFKIRIMDEHSHAERL